MPNPVSCPPGMILIPGAQYQGRTIEPIFLDKNPRTNAQYRAHADRHASWPFVLLMTHPETHMTSILCREKTAQEAIEAVLGKEMAKLAMSRLPKDWDTRDPFTFGAFTLFELRKDLSSEGFDRANQPVNASWFHAFEYCVGNGLFLPSDDQWSVAAGVHEGRKYPVAGTGEQLVGPNGEKLAHFYTAEEWRNEKLIKATIDVDDPSIPDGYNGLRHMAGEVWEWTDRNPSEEYPFGLRGGSYCRYDVPGANRNLIHGPHNRNVIIGFRAASLVSRGSPVFVS